MYDCTGTVESYRPEYSRLQYLKMSKINVPKKKWKEGERGSRTKYYSIG